MNCIYKASNKAPTYSNEEMYWIGYIYASIAFLYDKSFKSIYKLISPKEIVKYYNIYHTFSVETAAEKIMENINYSNLDINQKGVILRKKVMSNK